MILTPQQLWKDYDRTALPLAVSVLKATEDAACFSYYLYFNGEQASDGVARVFCKLYEPKGETPADSAVIVCDDPENDVDAFDPTEYLTRGFSVLVLDYAGLSENKPRYTLYPKSFQEANYFLNENLGGTDDSMPDKSCWYIWATCALRAITFLEDRGYQNNFMLGIGYGGAQVWKTCYFEGAIRAAATVFSTPMPNEMTLGYRAALASTSYANLAKVPVFIQTTSNEQNGSLDLLTELYENTVSRGSYFSISERANRVINPANADNPARWFLAKRNEESLPAPPILKAKASQNQLYYEIKLDCPDDVTDVALFVAHAQKNSAFRNWRNQTMQMVGEGEYLAKVPVLISEEPVYAFVNVCYKSGFDFSSTVVRVVPDALGITAEPLVLKRLIYDSTMGVSDWLVLHNPGGKPFLPTMQKGPFDLEGVGSPSNILTTFRLADPQFRGKSDATLQLTVFSAIKQEVVFHITTTSRQVYSARREFDVLDAWKKLTLSPNDFKGISAPLTSWFDILTFEIESTDTLLVGSMLWV